MWLALGACHAYLRWKQRFKRGHEGCLSCYGVPRTCVIVSPQLSCQRSRYSCCSQGSLLSGDSHVHLSAADLLKAPLSPHLERAKHVRYPGAEGCINAKYMCFEKIRFWFGWNLEAALKGTWVVYWGKPCHRRKKMCRYMYVCVYTWRYTHTHEWMIHKDPSLPCSHWPHHQHPPPLCI